MTVIRGIPPGRAGRTWLARRLRSALRGADLLDRRLVILRREQLVLALDARRGREDLDLSCAIAEAAALRAGLLAGEDSLRASPGISPAVVDIRWVALMGTRLPDSAQVQVAPRPGAARVAPSASVALVVHAYSDLLERAVQCAVAEGAARIVDAEVATTRSRLRAIEDRWVPRLTSAQSALEQVLAENERGEAVRIRWAASRPGRSMSNGEESP